MAEVHHRHTSDPIPHLAERAVPPGLLKRISWGAVFAGTIIAVGVTILLGLLGLAIGARAIDPAEAAAFEGVGTGTALWWIVSSVLALAIGGFVAGRTSGQPDRFAATAHGAATWGLVTLVTLWVATSAMGTIVNTATGAVSTVARASTSVVGTVGGAVGGALPDDLNLSPEARQARERIRAEANQILAGSGIDRSDSRVAQNAAADAAEGILRTPSNAGAEIDRLVDRLFVGPNAALSPAERQRLVEQVAQRAGVTPQEAEQIANRWQAQAQAAVQNIGNSAAQVREQVGEAGEAALDTASKVAWYAFFASLLSLAAAVIAAAIGAPRHGHAAYRETVAV